MAIVGLLSSFASAQPVAGSLWYSGDPNTGDWGNQGGGGLTYYQGFTVTDPAGWTIGDVYSVGPSWNTPGTAEWDIRTGMAPGNAGTDVIGGEGSVTNSSYEGHDVMTVDIGSLYLAPGTYWLEVAGGDVTTTNGANSIGTTDSTLRNWPLYGQSYIDLSYYGAASEGVTGVVGRASDTGSIISVLLGLGAIAVLKLRRTAIVR